MNRSRVRPRATRHKRRPIGLDLRVTFGVRLVYCLGDNRVALEQLVEPALLALSGRASLQYCDRMSKSGVPTCPYRPTDFAALGRHGRPSETLGLPLTLGFENPSCC